jgi:hypothetical protein
MLEEILPVVTTNEVVAAVVETNAASELLDPINDTEVVDITALFDWIDMLLIVEDAAMEFETAVDPALDWPNDLADDYFDRTVNHTRRRLGCSLSECTHSWRSIANPIRWLTSSVAMII